MEWLIIAGVVALVASKRSSSSSAASPETGGGMPGPGAAAAAGFGLVNSITATFGGALTAFVADPPSQPQQPGGQGPNLNPLDGSELDRATREARDSAQASGRGAAAATDRAAAQAVRHVTKLVF